MRWEEFANNFFIQDEESLYDGWEGVNFYTDYRRDLFGIQVGMNRMGNKLTADESFNIELKCTFPNIILIDNYERKDEKMKFFCEACKQKFIKTGDLVLLSGCPNCNKHKYRGEELLKRILDKKGIIYTHQISCGCINPKTGRELYYDFVIEYGNELIFVEIQGKQHYQPVDFFGGEEAYEYNAYKDEIKKVYAEENGIYIALDYKEHNLQLLEERIYEQLMILIK